MNSESILKKWYENKCQLCGKNICLSPLHIMKNHHEHNDLCNILLLCNYGTSSCHYGWRNHEFCLIPLDIDKKEWKIYSPFVGRESLNNKIIKFHHDHKIYEKILSWLRFNVFAKAYECGCELPEHCVSEIDE